MTRAIDWQHGTLVIPSEPEIRSLHAERCVRAVFAGEYAYPRAAVEDVRSIVDVGCNVGAFLLWACLAWWPDTVERVYGFDPNSTALRFAYLNLAGLRQKVDLYDSAVTTDPNPLFREEDNWGASHTYKATEGVIVPPLHPRDLPAADVLKVDCEGCGGQVAREYRHWSRVRFAMYETHNEEEREELAAACEHAGMTMVRGNPMNPPNDVRVWRR
jgi:FkbM family methyltransferase